MRSNRRRWTVVAVVVWVVALALTSIIAPTPAQAAVEKMGWMTYAPNHPNSCVPLPWDCYVIVAIPD